MLRGWANRPECKRTRGKILRHRRLRLRRDAHANIDLWRRWRKISRAFACTPVCSPSRVTYLTGAIPSRHGVQDWLLPEDSYGPTTRNWYEGLTPYSEILANNGYNPRHVRQVAHGRDDKAQAGFSYWATVPGGGGPYRGMNFVIDGESRAMPGFKPTSSAIARSTSCRARRPKIRSTFSSLSTRLTLPTITSPKSIANGLKAPKFSCFPRTPMNPWQNRDLAGMHNDVKSMHAYSALIAGVDHNVGRIVKRLEAMGVRDNTLVIFTADQGWNAATTESGAKATARSPSICTRVAARPMIWNHPGAIRAGQTLSPMISSTITSRRFSITSPSPRPPGKRPGRSYAGFLRGARPQWRNRLYFEYEYVRGIRTENLKYIERTREWPSELFDLESDPGETRNAINDPRHKKQLEALRAELKAFFKKTARRRLRIGAPQRSRTCRNISPCRSVAYALVRAASRLISTPVSSIDTSVDAARTSAYATRDFSGHKMSTLCAGTVACPLIECCAWIRSSTTFPRAVFRTPGTKSSPNFPNPWRRFCIRNAENPLARTISRRCFR